MPTAQLHRDVDERSYFSGILAAFRNRLDLVDGFSKYFGDESGLRYGWRDMDPHTMDIAVEGSTVARVESHHNREDVFVFLDHPQAQKFVEEAIRRGYMPVAKDPAS